MLILKTVVNFLGIMLDNQLKFNSHILTICNKISKSSGILNRLKSFVPTKIMIQLYYSMIYPYITYCNLIWGGACHNHLSTLITLQKKIIRIITNESYLAHTKPLFYNTGILNIENVHSYVLAIYMFKKRNLFNDCFHHNYSTRNKQNLVPKFQRLIVTQQSVNFSGVRVWNDLPAELKNCHSLAKFKFMLRRRLLENCNNYY